MDGGAAEGPQGAGKGGGGGVEIEVLDVCGLLDTFGVDGADPKTVNG